MKTRSAFTLVELLVVVAVIALLAGIIAPSLRRAKVLATRAVCLTRLKIVHSGCAQYADDFGQWYPYRPRPPLPTGHYLAHQMRGSTFDLNQTFITRYLTRREVSMFCPGALWEARNPDAPGWNTDSGYRATYATYQYFNYGTSTGLVEDFPGLYNSVISPPYYALWGCLTVEKHYLTPSRFLAHDVAERPDTPDGMNAVYVSGNGRWVPWQRTEMFYDTTQSFHWPEPDDGDDSGT